MAADYDLVVVGSSQAGIEAAIAARNWRARVALITQTEGQPSHPEIGLGAIVQAGRWRHQQQIVAGLGLSVGSAASLLPPSPEQLSSTWESVKRWAEAVQQQWSEVQSWDKLTSLGIDVMLGQGQFVGEPKLAFSVPSDDESGRVRSLRSRSYLLAPRAVPRVPLIPGLDSHLYDTVDQVATWETLPQRVVVIGGDPDGMAIAQALARLGAEVWLVVRGPHGLTQADSEIAGLLQAQLEADGVHLLSQTAVTQVEQQGGETLVKTGEMAIATDRIVVAAGQRLSLESLNLEAAGVRERVRGLRVNGQLQTSNPRIYLCGTIHGSYQWPSVAAYEAQIALKNALFFPGFSMSDRPLVRGVNTDPEVAWLGLTESQAVEKYGTDLLISHQRFQALPAAHLRQETLGLCKLIGRRNGEIVGVHLIGARASELIAVFALAMQQKLKIPALAELTLGDANRSEIVQQTAIAWQQARLQRQPTRQNFIEGWLNFRRSWS